MVYVPDRSDVDVRLVSLKMLFCHVFSPYIEIYSFFDLELLSRFELPNLLITNEVLYLLSYNSTIKSGISR